MQIGDLSWLSASDADSADLMRPTVDLMPDSVNLMRGPLVAVGRPRASGLRPRAIGRAARQQIPRASDSVRQSRTLRLRQSDAPQVGGIRFTESGQDCRPGMAMSQGRVNGMRVGRLPEDSNMTR